MANPFEELEKAKKPDAPVAAPSPGINPFGGIENPTPSQSPETKQESGLSGPLLMADNIMRRIASAATLGLVDKLDARPEQDAQFKRDHPYIATGAEIAGSVAPSGVGSLAVAKAIPSLGKATIPSMMGNAAVTGGVLSPIEDIIKGNTDPKMMAARAGASAATGAVGAGVLGGILRMLPGYKFRAAGSDLTDADKAAMKELAATGDRAGIPLRIPELAAERAPGRAARVEGLDNFMGKLKSGEIARRNFDAGRLPNIQAAVDKVKNVVGPAPDTGLRAQRGAESAINSAEDLVRNSASPYYDNAMDVVLPQRQSAPNILETRKGLYKDKVIEPEIRNADPNSIRVLQQTADALEGQIKNNKGGPNRERLLVGQKRGLINEMEAASPDFATGQSITAGGKGMVDELIAGPLGTIKGTTKPSTQTRALLDAPAGNSAIGRLEVADPGLPRSMLATEVNSLSKDPVSFGRKLAPTADAESNISRIVGDQDFNAIKDIITAARARTKTGAPGGGENADGPVGALWDIVQNTASKGVVDRMNNPKNIDKLGDPGTLQRLLQAFGLGAEDVSIDNLLREPLVVDVKPKRRDNTRTANAR